MKGRSGDVFGNRRYELVAIILAFGHDDPDYPSAVTLTNRGKAGLDTIYPEGDDEVFITAQGPRDT